MSTRARLLFYLTAWLIVLLPFLFWWNTWFGRQLPDRQITEYLRDDKRPRHIQHALVQIGERIMRHDATIARWYPELIRLAEHPVEEVRNTDAWVMGQDTAGAGFHEALLKMLEDPSPMVRGNAALSLVRFKDDSGREQIVALLQPAHIASPRTARVTDTARVGTAIRQGGIIAKLQTVPATPTTQIAETTMEIRSPITGRIHSLSVTTGASVAAGTEIAVVDPGDEQVWEALRALYLIGRAEDLPAIRRYERESRDIPGRIRQQALLADQVIRSRASAQP
ncbi:MAG TPA: HlyD family efflux transporter periplasmic adaptor subunit [Candidatus Dormibacteraeota bacterium]|nr:HlyD family efflux transporter periplasmic adaptor subunit [Candidatus Dormibacteraeota bacterium]